MGKKMKKTFVMIGVCIAAIILFCTATYTTKENEYTVVKQFGKIRMSFDINKGLIAIYTGSEFHSKKYAVL